MNSRRLFMSTGLAAIVMASIALPDRALAFSGVDAARGDRITVMLSTPTDRCLLGTFGSMDEAMGMIGTVAHEARGMGVDFTISAPEAQPLDRIAFVDGSAFLGAEQLRVFYRDSVYAPKHAAMQPDNGAGQVSGDRAQSVGKPGDLKAGVPGGVKSGSETPGAKAIDARKQSWIERRFRRFIASSAS